MKTLIVGDPHIKADELDDCEELFDLIFKTIEDEEIKRVVFLGDQYHNHGIMNVEVLAFLHRWFTKLSTVLDGRHSIIALVGNHDKPAQGSDVHSMLAHTSQVAVISDSLVLDGVLYVANTDNKTFIDICNDNKDVETLVCHQTFNGCEYANGFYAKDGVMPTDVPQKLVISGHIHTPQSFSKVIYPGAPRWLTSADANMERNIWVVDFDRQGQLKGEVKKINTGVACNQIIHYIEVEKEDFKVSGNLDGYKSTDTIIVDIYGTAKFIEERVAWWSKQDFKLKIRTHNTEVTKVTVRESDGIYKAFQKYIDAYKPPNMTEKDVLIAMSKERLTI